MRHLRMLFLIIGLFTALSRAEIIEERLEPFDCISTPRHYCISMETGDIAIRNGLKNTGS